MKRFVLPGAILLCTLTGCAHQNTATSRGVVKALGACAHAAGAADKKDHSAKPRWFNSMDHCMGAKGYAARPGVTTEHTTTTITKLKR